MTEIPTSFFCGGRRPTGQQHVREKNMRRLSVILALLALLPATADLARAATPPAQPAEPEAAAQDPLGRSTPRGTVLGFIKAAQAEDYARAAEYLDSQDAAARKQQLARELKTVLDRELSAVVALLSPK